MEDFGERLKRVREAHGLDQADLFGEADDAKRKSFGNYVSRLERGEASNPSLEILTRIAGAMSLSLSDFFRQLESENPRDLIRQTDGLTSAPLEPIQPKGAAHDVKRGSMARRKRPPEEVSASLVQLARLFWDAAEYTDQAARAHPKVRHAGKRRSGGGR